MQTSEHYLLGIDLGTTNVKAILMDEHGCTVAAASRANDRLYPGPGMVEQDPAQWWRNTVAILQEITAAASPGIIRKIRGISISSQTVSMLPVDRDGTPLRNALIWMDSRSTDELRDILNTVGRERFISIVGGQPDAAFLPNKILWYKKHEPQLFEKTYRILQASSYLNYMLTGEMTMDMDQASRTHCLDLTSLSWSEEISAAIGADLNALLPPPVASSRIIGHVTAGAAAQTGLISGIPVVAGASDALASMYAIGLSRTGDAGESSGTTSLVFIGHDQPSRTDLPVVARPCPIPAMPYLFDAPISASGASVNWYLDTLGLAEKQQAEAMGTDVWSYMNTTARDVAAGAGGLLYFPYMLGERAPLWNSYARGMFIGLTLNTGRPEIIRAVFEGTAFALRHVIDTITATGVTKPKALRITGGGAKSPLWSQIKASMLNMPVQILDERSGDVPFGDVLIAGHAVGVFPDLPTAMQKLVQIKETIEPVPEWTAAYDKLYPFYLDMYQHLDKDLMKLQETVRTL